MEFGEMKRNSVIWAFLLHIKLVIWKSGSGSGSGRICHSKSGKIRLRPDWKK